MQPEPTDQYLQSFGLSREDYELDNMEEVSFFEDMHESWDAFMSLSTQWNVSPDGSLIGINYNSFQVVAKIYKISDEEAAFTDVRIMEQELLRIVRSKRP